MLALTVTPQPHPPHFTKSYTALLLVAKEQKKNLGPFVLSNNDTATDAVFRIH